ncbi:MAG: HlpA protein [Candidatus Jettenia ecosi]|uniref:HlpA protein n=1 Tax=Candidatus Jettenia ecosi TaxID=2494326 RepID=A0A533QC11_9BACT|nr:MAG: HlpA protein [Candidatus Jettenia ecosi]
MPNWKLETPVVFLIFNRPDTTEKVFEVIRQAKPPKLLVVADGPRADRSGEVEKCAAVRAIIDRVDWDCEVLKNYSDINMGCKQRISSGLDWVFDTVEEAIILEDDCLPHPTFFRFCEELLEKYRSDERIAMIGGINFQFGKKRTNNSYYFSRYNHIWGWASWSRAWQYYDVEMRAWPLIRDGKWLEDILGDSRLAKHWEGVFQATFEGKINTWDYQWAFACWMQGALAILPNSNLVSNIGFNTEATHTSGQNAFANMRTESLEFPLLHPRYLIHDAMADKYTEKVHFSINSTPIRVINKFKKILNKL